MADNRGIKLTMLQTAFLREYLLCRNASESMRRAGYKSKNPDVDGPKLLKNKLIKQAIEAAEKKAQEKFEIKQDDILRELTDVAFGNIGEVLDWGADGEVKLKPKNMISKRGLTFIESIKIERGAEKVKGKEGEEDTFETYIKDLKITTLGKEKVKALKLLGEHTGLWGNDESGGAEGGDQPPTDQGPRVSSVERVSELLRKFRER